MSEDAPSPQAIARDQRQALRAVVRAIGDQRSFRDCLNQIASEAQRLTGAATVAVGLRTGREQELEFVAVAGGNPAEIIGMTIRGEHSIAASAMRTGLPSLFGQPGDGALADGPLRAGAVVPISREDGAVGALFALRHPTEPEFTTAEVDLLGVFADLADVALQTSSSRRRGAEQARELAVLYEAAGTISGSLNLQDVLDSVLEAICRHIPHSSAAVFLLNDERSHLFIAADRGLSDEARDVQLDAHARVVADALSSTRPRPLSEAALTDLTGPVGEPAPRSALVAAMRSRHDAIGLILVTSALPDAFSLNDIPLVAAVSAQAGIAIENAWLFEDATRRNEEATALYSLSQHVNSSLDPERIGGHVADSVMSILKVDRLAIMVMDSATGRLTTRAQRGLSSEAWGSASPAPGEGIAGWVFEWMTPTAVSDVAADARNRTAPIEGAGVTSALCVPMAVGDDVLGVILAMSARRRLFTVAEMETLYTIANMAAVSIVNATLYQDARRRSRSMRAYLNQIARSLGTALEDFNLPQVMADLTLRALDVDRCAVYGVAGSALELKAAANFRPTALPNPTIDTAMGFTGWVARKGRALVVGDCTEDERAGGHPWLHRDRQASYLGVPLKAGRRTLGVLEVYTTSPRVFTPDEVRLATSFATRVRLAERL